MRSVPLPEFELLTIAKALFAPTDMVRPLLAEARTPPGLDIQKNTDKNKTTDNRNATAKKLTSHFRLSEDGLAALEQVLSVGTVRILTQGGGWRRNPHFDAAGKLQVARIWERQPNLPIGFSDATPRLLWWLLESPLAANPTCTLRPALHPGDQLAVYLTGAMLVRADLLGVLKHPIFAENPLFSLINPIPTLVPDYRPLLTSPRVILLEGLQAHLEQGVILAERQLMSIVDPVKFEAAATLRQRCLNGFLDACEEACRRDLAHFLVDFVTRNPFPVPPKLDPKTPLSARAAAANVAPIMPRLAVRLGRWQRDLESLHFFDDGYQDARGILKRWNRLTPARLEQARQAEATMLNAFSTLL